VSYVTYPLPLGRPRGATVKFGTKTSSTVAFVSPTQLKALAPPGSPGTVRVVVHTPAGISPATTADKYKYN
jgi:trimeric autotransporter adhesin